MQESCDTRILIQSIKIRVHYALKSTSTAANTQLHTIPEMSSPPSPSEFSEGPEPGPPKKAMNPYMVFLQEQRKIVQAENSHKSVREVVSHVAAMWRELPQAERKPYEEKAQIDKARFNEECAKWIDGPPKKPMNSYLLFAQEQRQNIVKANPEMSVPEIVSHTATLWRHLSDEQKLPYVERARQDKQTFDEERNRWLVQSRDSRNQFGNKKFKGRKGHWALAEKKIKRVSPAYIFFSKENRKVVQAAQPGWKMCDVSKELGRLWRELGAEERKPYEAQHEQDKERHRTEIAAISAGSAAGAASGDESDEQYQHQPAPYRPGDMHLQQQMMMQHMYPSMMPYNAMHQQSMQAAAAAYHQYAAAMHGQYAMQQMQGAPGGGTRLAPQPQMMSAPGMHHMGVNMAPPQHMMRMTGTPPHTWGG